MEDTLQAVLLFSSVLVLISFSLIGIILYIKHDSEKAAKANKRYFNKSNNYHIYSY